MEMRVNISFSVVILLALPACVFAQHTLPNTTESSGASTAPVIQNFQLNGSATFVDDVLRLTDKEWQAGSVFWKTPMDITSFDTTFTFRLHTDQEKGTADGITFCIHNDPRGAKAMGIRGGWIGYGCDAGKNMITKSVAIEFDNYCNTGDGFQDVSRDHVGVNVKGDPVSVVTAKTSFYITDVPVNVRISYSGKWLDVWAWRDGQEQQSPLIHHEIDITTIVGSNTAYVGFTGGTGCCFQKQDIWGWKF